MTIKYSELPIYHKNNIDSLLYHCCNSLLLIGELRYPNSNGDTEERNCVNKIVRILYPSSYNAHTSVIVEDENGHNWRIKLDRFTNWEKIEII